jgi:hypothetical protein
VFGQDPFLIELSSLEDGALEDREEGLKETRYTLDFAIDALAQGETGIKKESNGLASCIRFDPLGNSFFLATTKGIMHVYDLQRNLLRSEKLTSGASSITSFHFTSSGRWGFLIRKKKKK